MIILMWILIWVEGLDVKLYQPAIILQTKDIPYTINGKKVEIAVKKIVHGEEVTNQDALANPESLDLYRNINELL